MTNLDVTLDVLGESIWSWCLEILGSVQRVLDAPTFIAILQVLTSIQPLPQLHLCPILIVALS